MDSFQISENPVNIRHGVSQKLNGCLRDQKVSHVADGPQHQLLVGDEDVVSGVPDDRFYQWELQKFNYLEYYVKRLNGQSNS